MAREEAGLNTGRATRLPTPAMDVDAGMPTDHQTISPSLHVPSRGSSQESMELFNLNSVLRAIDEIINRAWFEQRALSQITTRSVESMGRESVTEDERSKTL